MLIETKYQYEVLERVPINGIRHYKTPHGLLPSVTTILSSTLDKTYLDEWIKAVGEEKAQAICAEAATIGTTMHDNLERYVLSGAAPIGSFYTKALTNLIIDRGLPKVSHVWGVEASLYHSTLYAGTCDLVGVHNGVPAIIDYKNSLRHKIKDQILGYFLQLAAYALAHNSMFGTNINKGVIMMATRQGDYLEFVVEGEEFEQYQVEWCSSVDSYYAKINDK